MSHSEDYEDTGRTRVFYEGMSAGRFEERQRIITIIEKRRDYDCRCKCDCHAEPAPCVGCQADNELIEIIRGGPMHSSDCFIAQGKWDGGCTCKGERK